MAVKICGRQSGREKDLEGKMAVPEKFFSTTLLLKDLKSLKNVFLWYVAVESAKMVVV
jgi:hypothetical protein